MDQIPPRGHESWSPSPGSQALPAKREPPFSKAHEVSGLGLAGATWKAHWRWGGPCFPWHQGPESKHMAASACIVSVLCFYIYIYISIILLKKEKVLLILSLGKARAVSIGTPEGRGTRRGVGEGGWLAQGYFF